MNDMAYTYRDVLIQPQYSEVESRSNVDLTTKLGDIILNLPVISSNMKTITGPKMAFEMNRYGGMGILHRFNTTKQACEDFEETVKKITDNAMIDSHWTGFTPQQSVGVSIGVKEEDKSRFLYLHVAGARVFCIDVAHGHHKLVKDMLAWIKTTDAYKEGGTTLIVGNIATPQAYTDLMSWGADVVKVGIGPSQVCRTRYNTGVGVPQLYALKTIYEKSCEFEKPVPIIADGGITHVGDISKALKYADAVMIGSMISGCSETPGQVFRNENGEFYKVYGGSASGENKGENRFVEGIIKTVKFKGKIKYILREIRQGLQSAFSYVGANNHKEFQEKCKFNFISNGSQYESKI